MSRRRPRQRRKAVSAIAALALAAVLAVATGCNVSIDIGGDDSGPRESRDDTFSVGSSPVLAVSSENESVRVEAGSPGTVRVRATLRNAPEVRYDVRQDGSAIIVEAEVDEGARDAGVDIRVTAPPETAVEVVTSNGSVELDGLQSSGTLRTSNSSVKMTDVGGGFRATTSNGAIEVKGMEGTATLETSNGPVTLEDVTGAFDVATSNGDISFSGEMIAEGKNRLETSNRSVTVKLEGTPSVNLDATASSGKVSCELEIEATRAEDDELVGTIGGGEAELVVRTSNGSVTVE